MFKNILNFIKYNNAAAIIISLVFGGVSASFAASPTLRDSVYSSSSVVSSVDNKLIVSADLENFNFSLKINSVKEDAENYYVDYSYDTLSIVNSIWQNTNLNKTLQVNKAGLEGKDLGLYVAKQLADNINAELDYLKRVQGLEKNKGESSKIVTTEYGGLVGKFLDPKQEVIEGYTPLIPDAPTDATAPAPLGSGTDTPPGERQVENDSAPQDRTPKTLDESDVQRIIDQYLADHKQVTEPTQPTPDPSPAPVVTPPSVVPPPEEVPPPVTPPPVVDPTPDPTPAPTPDPNATPNPPADPGASSTSQ